MNADLNAYNDNMIAYHVAVSLGDYEKAYQMIGAAIQCCPVLEALPHLKTLRDQHRPRTGLDAIAWRIGKAWRGE